MANKIYVNLPVKDLQRSIEFYKVLGFTQNLEFTDDFGAGLVWSENIWVNLLTQDFFLKFSAGLPIADAHKSAQVLNSLSFDSNAEVDKFVDAGAANGGTLLPAVVMEGAEGIYIRDIADLDGHIWEAIYQETSG